MQGRAYPADPGAPLGGWRHQGEGVIQEGVHLLTRLLDGRLGGHVGRRCGGRIKDFISRRRAAAVWGQIWVRLWGKRKLNSEEFILKWLL